MDKLDEIFKMQNDAQIRMGTMPFTNDKEQQAFINTMSLALIDEVMEALRETPWKPWKKQQTFNIDKFESELVDAWHFLINLTIATGMTSGELYNEFHKKNGLNALRQKEGY